MSGLHPIDSVDASDGDNSLFTYGLLTDENPFLRQAYSPLLKIF
jgi:hypothetical protein